MRTPQIRSILTGVEIDESERPDPVLVTAHRLATALGADLHVVHAVESGPITPPLLPSLSRDLSQAADALDVVIEDALPSGAEPVSRHVALGRAHRVLAERAAELDVDLLVVGPHRDRGIGSGLGTTTDRLLRTSKRPCWVARGDVELPLRHLAMATDFSVRSHPALDRALALAADLGGADAGVAPPRLDVVYVEWPATLDHDPDLVERELLPQLADEIAAAVDRTGLSGAAVPRPRVIGAVDPSRGILAHIAEESPSVVALGTHGRGAVARTLLGSVASVVAREAPCDVLLVPTPESLDD
ncbi:MAG: universal stress protein [Longimicrobiales bacterium]